MTTAKYSHRSRRTIKKVRRALRLIERPGKLVTIDIENYEHKQTYIMEIGVSIFRLNTEPTTHHFIIDKHVDRHNKKYTAGNKNCFNFGKSQVTSILDAIAQTKKLIEGSVVLGHGSGGDDKQLARYDLAVQSLDTQILRRILTGEPKQLSLKAQLDELNITHSHLHNGGNDAHFTALAVKSLITQLHANGVHESWHSAMNAIIGEGNVWPT